MSDRKETPEASSVPVEKSQSTEPSLDPESHEDGVRRDYAGARPKTDPAEIRLVRKLDFRIMVSPSRISLTRTRILRLDINYGGT